MVGFGNPFGESQGSRRSDDRKGLISGQNPAGDEEGPDIRVVVDVMVGKKYSAYLAELELRSR
jgi:hypothetical protein